MDREEGTRGAHRGPTWLGLWLVLLSATVFVVDLQRPVGFNHSLLYVMVVVLTLGYPRSGWAVGAAATGTVLDVLGFVLSPAGGIVPVGRRACAVTGKEDDRRVVGAGARCEIGQGGPDAVSGRLSVQ